MAHIEFIVLHPGVPTHAVRATAKPRINTGQTHGQGIVETIQRAPHN